MKKTAKMIIVGIGVFVSSLSYAGLPNIKSLCLKCEVNYAVKFSPVKIDCLMFNKDIIHYKNQRSKVIKFKTACGGPGFRSR